MAIRTYLRMTSFSEIKLFSVPL